jgi:arylsulfatase A-like enzyme
VAQIFFGGMHWPKEGGHEAPWLFGFDAGGRYPDAARAQVKGFSSALYADAAMEFLERRVVLAAEPFFAYVAFTSPHDPRTPPPAYARLYDASRITLPPNVRPAHPFDNGELDVRDELLAPRPLTPDAVRRELAGYYAMISEVDAQIGRLLDTLDRTALSSRTIVVFASDNGLAVGSHGLLGKQNLYEESIRVPLVLAGPGIPEGERRDGLVLLQDLVPTLLDLLGQPAVPGDGRTLVPALRAPDARLRDGIYAAYRSCQRAYRTADGWKIVRYRAAGTERWQLFDLTGDPYETRDLSTDPSHAARLRSLQRALVDAGRAAGDPDADPVPSAPIAASCE